MKKAYTHNKVKQEWVAIVLLALTVLSLVYAAASLIRYALTSESDLALTVTGPAQADPNEEQLKTYLAADRKRVDKIKKDNLYAPAPPPRNPVSQVLGIMGKEALINGQWHKVGAKIGDATIVAMTPNSVIVEWKGQKTTFEPIDAQGDAGASAGPPPGAGPGPGPGPSMPAGAVMSMPSGARAGPPPITPEEMERLKSLPPEEQRAFVEARMKSMSR